MSSPASSTSAPTTEGWEILPSVAIADNTLPPPTWGLEPRPSTPVSPYQPPAPLPSPIEGADMVPVMAWGERPTSPTTPAPSCDLTRPPTPQLARRTEPIEGPKICFRPLSSRRVQEEDQEREAKIWKTCYKCKAGDHLATACPLGKKVPRMRNGQRAPSPKAAELAAKAAKKRAAKKAPSPFELAQTLPVMTLLERVEKMRSREWTPKVCAHCWKRNPGHRESDCPHKEMCWTCRGTGPAGYRRRHVCKMWADEPDILMHDVDDGVYQGRD